jgi:hypothetical protein
MEEKKLAFILSLNSMSFILYSRVRQANFLFGTAIAI